MTKYNKMNQDPQGNGLAKWSWEDQAGLEPSPDVFLNCY